MDNLTKYREAKPADVDEFDSRNLDERVHKKELNLFLQHYQDCVAVIEAIFPNPNPPPPPPLPRRHLPIPNPVRMGGQVILDLVQDGLFVHKRGLPPSEIIMGMNPPLTPVERAEVLRVIQLLNPNYTERVRMEPWPNDAGVIEGPNALLLDLFNEMSRFPSVIMDYLNKVFRRKASPAILLKHFKERPLRPPAPPVGVMRMTVDRIRQLTTFWEPPIANPPHPFDDADADFGAALREFWLDYLGENPDKYQDRTAGEIAYWDKGLPVGLEVNGYRITEVIRDAEFPFIQGKYTVMKDAIRHKMRVLRRFDKPPDVTRYIPVEFEFTEGDYVLMIHPDYALRYWTPPQHRTEVETLIRVNNPAGAPERWVPTVSPHIYARVGVQDEDLHFGTWRKLYPSEDLATVRDSILQELRIYQADPAGINYFNARKSPEMEAKITQLNAIFIPRNVGLG